MVRKRLGFANVVSLLALFVALGGTSYAAAKLSANSVGSAQIRKGAVTRSKIRDHAVNAAKVAPHSLGAGVFAPGTLLQGARGPSDGYLTQTIGPLQPVPGVHLVSLALAPGSYFVTAKLRGVSNVVAGFLNCQLTTTEPPNGVIDEEIENGFAVNENVNYFFIGATTLTKPGSVYMRCTSTQSTDIDLFDFSLAAVKLGANHVMN